jgi:hypothetical protein
VTYAQARPVRSTAEMVNATLEGRKTQMRYVVKTDTRQQSNDAFMRGFPPNPQNVRMCGTYAKCDAPAGSRSVSYRVPCPYGLFGDYLWVRETFGYYVGQIWCPSPIPKGPSEDCRVIYAADERGFDEDPASWCPSVHMPRWMSRLLLEVVNVRVERLQAITEADGIAEGIPYPPMYADEPLPGATYARKRYAALWDSLNGKKPGCAWVDNPWVWVVEFKRMEVQS